MRDFSIKIIDTGRSILVGYKDRSYSQDVPYEKDDIRRGSRDIALQKALSDIHYNIAISLLTADREDRLNQH